MRIISRAEWGAAPAKRTTELNPAVVRLFVVHHTATPFQDQKSIRAIQKFHQGPERRWSDIGYNFLVAPNGMVYEGRGWGFRGAHAKGHNFESVGVAYVGHGSKPVPAPARRAIADLYREAEKRCGSLQVVGHRDVGRTACPGDVLYRWVAQGGAEEPPVARERPVPREEPPVARRRPVPRSDRPAWMDAWAARLLGRR